MLRTQRPLIDWPSVPQPQNTGPPKFHRQCLSVCTPASIWKAHAKFLFGNRFTIPFMFSATLGLAAVALRDDPGMRVLLPKDVSAGLPAPSAAVSIVLFLAVTSMTSTELIAVSSILTYDIYKVFLSSRWHVHTIDAFSLRNTST